MRKATVLGVFFVMLVGLLMSGEGGYAANTGVTPQADLQERSALPTPRTAEALRTTIAPTLDGDLGEWSAIPETILSQETARWVNPVGTVPDWQDASLVLQAMWDSDHLYFGLHANDDLLVRDSGTNLWWDDMIVIWVDGDGDGEQRGLYDHQYALLTDGLAKDWNQPTDLVMVTQTVTGGWDVEVAVPASHFPAGALVEGNQIRFTFAYADDDEGGTWDSWMEWEGYGDNNSTAVDYGYLLLGGPAPTPTPTVTPTATDTPTLISSQT